MTTAGSPPPSTQPPVPLDWQGLINAAIESLHPTAANPQPTRATAHRAVSTAYYAAFHALMESNASSIIAHPDTDLKVEAWTQIYRMPSHQETRNRLMAARAILPEPARSFASALANLYDARINADYNDRDRWFPPDAIRHTSRHRRHHPDPKGLTTKGASTFSPTTSPSVAGVSRDTDAGPD